MLAGRLEMTDFLKMLKNDKELQTELCLLVPSAAIDNSNHQFWVERRAPYSMLKRYGFVFFKYLASMCRFDGSIGDNLSIFSIIKRAYLYHKPDFICTEKYQCAHNLYLAVTDDCFEVVEARYLLSKTIMEALKKKTEKEQIQFAKKAVEALFHVQSCNRPRWLHGPEWPMGKYSPMQFVSQKYDESTETITYAFIDVDTQETRLVQQFH